MVSDYIQSIIADGNGNRRKGEDLRELLPTLQKLELILEDTSKKLKEGMVRTDGAM